MNKSILYLPLLFLWGCSSLPIQVNWNPQESEPTETAEEGCSEQPSASLSNPEAIAIDNQRVTKSGTLRSGKDVGYTFQGRAGQKLNFALSDDVCIWFYTPTNELMSGVELPQDGTYIVQLGTSQGTTTYDLEIGLEEDNAIVATSPSVPQPVQTPVPNPSYVPSTPTPVPTPTPTPTFQPQPANNNPSAIGWIWIGAVNNQRGTFSYGEALIPTNQPVTITPSIVPSPGQKIRLTTDVNLRTNVPQPPNFNLPSKRGKVYRGQQLVVVRVEGFVDPDSSNRSTRIWAQVARP